MPVIFYPNEKESTPASPSTFSWTDLKAGFTLVLLYGERKQFMDCSVGIRCEEPDDATVFRASLATVVRESIEIGKSNCFQCHNTGTSKCGRCKVSTYCSKECQASHWPIHKQLCSQMPLLRELVKVLQSPFNGYASFPQILSSSKAQIP